MRVSVHILQAEELAEKRNQPDAREAVAIEKPDWLVHASSPSYLVGD
jgi:hypothetical protein